MCHLCGKGARRHPRRRVPTGSRRLPRGDPTPSSRRSFPGSRKLSDRSPWARPHIPGPPASCPARQAPPRARPPRRLPSPASPGPRGHPRALGARLRAGPGRQRAGSLTRPQLVLDSEELLSPGASVPAGPRGGAAAAALLHLLRFPIPRGSTRGPERQRTPGPSQLPLQPQEPRCSGSRTRTQRRVSFPLWPHGSLLRLLPLRRAPLVQRNQTAPWSAASSFKPLRPQPARYRSHSSRHRLLGTGRAHMSTLASIGQSALTLPELPRPAPRIVVAWRGGRRGRSATAPIGESRDCAPPTATDAHAQSGPSLP